MATQQQQQETPPDKLVECPECHSLVHMSEIQPRVFEQYPELLYRRKGEAKSVASDDERDKALGEGWRESPEDAEKDAEKPAQPGKTTEPAKPTEAPKPSHSPPPAAAPKKS